jgi:hypothetical protein
MFKNFGKKKIVISAVIILIALNVLAFYILTEGIGIIDALKHEENEIIKKSLEQKLIFSDVFPSLVFTIDIALLFLLAYLFIKKFFKSLKKSTPTK